MRNFPSPRFLLSCLAVLAGGVSAGAQDFILDPPPKAVPAKPRPAIPPVARPVEDPEIRRAEPPDASPRVAPPVRKATPAGPVKVRAVEAEKQDLSDDGSKGLETSLLTQTDARTLTLIIPAPRGQIVDRYGATFAQSRVAHHVALEMIDLRTEDDSVILAWARSRIARAGGILGTAMNVDDETILRHYRNRRWAPLRISPILSAAQVGTIESRLGDGLGLQAVYHRYYPHADMAAHIIGYVGKKAKLPVRAIQNGDPLFEHLQGREGLEKTYDEELTGKSGRINMLFDPEGRKLAENFVNHPVPGGTVVTALNLKVQQLAERILDKSAKRGALILLDVTTGDVLALASKPSFDLNLFIPYISSDAFKALQDDPDVPLFPRAFRGAYPPASTFKPIVAMAALEQGVVYPESQRGCPSALYVGDRLFHNWNRKAHEGQLNVKEAIMRSCNTWFYQVGLETGSAPILNMARDFGFGAPTGLPLQGEAAGRIPTGNLNGGGIANISIGQGEILASPLQVAQAMAAIAVGSRVPKVRLVIQIQDAERNVIKFFPPGEKNALNFKPVNLQAVRQGMHDVVHAARGTAKSANVKGADVCGKTGTGQWGPVDQKRYLSWFSGFAPFGNPKVAFVGIYEGNPGEYVTGGRKAAPMVGELLRTLYKDPAEYGMEYLLVEEEIPAAKPVNSGEEAPADGEADPDVDLPPPPPRITAPTEREMSGGSERPRAFVRPPPPAPVSPKRKGGWFSRWKRR